MKSNEKMGGKGKKTRPNGYALFAEMKSKELGISMQEAFGRCAAMWEEVPKQEKERYKEMAKGKTSSPSSLGIEVGLRTPHQDTRTALVQQLDAEEQDEEELEAMMFGWIDRRVKPKPSDGDAVNMDSYFVVGHINIYCSPRDKSEPLMPAEVAFARFSLSEGVKETFHALLNLTPLPMMYTYSAKAHAEKTHHIPPRAGLGEKEAAAVKRDLANFLRNEPVFVADTYKDHGQRENMARFLRESLDMGGEVYDLPSLLATMEKTVVGYRPETGAQNNGPWLALIGQVLNTPSSAEKYFEDDPFLFKTKSNEACDFHHAIDNGQFCSLNIVKRRVYSIWAKAGRRALMPASGSLAGLEKEAANVPVAVEVLADETDPEVVNFRRAACMKEFVNAFGQQVTRAGTMNGQVNLNPESDPEVVMREMRGKQEQMSFSNLTIDEEKYRGGLPAADDDDDETTSVTTTTTATDTGSVLGPSSDFPSLSSAMSSVAGGARRRGPPEGFVVPSAFNMGPESVQSGATTVTTTDNSVTSSKRKSRLVAKFGV